MPVQEVCEHKEWKEEVWGRQREAARPRQEKAHKSVDWLWTVTWRDVKWSEMAHEERSNRHTHPAPKLMGYWERKERNNTTYVHCIAQFNYLMRQWNRAIILNQYHILKKEVEKGVRVTVCMDSPRVHLSFLQFLNSPPTSQKNKCNGLEYHLWCIPASLPVFPQ